MSHFGRSGPPDIRDTYSLLVLNITFRTTADDLFPLFDKYGKVVDVFIPRDRRTGDSRGFAFVRYKYQDEAQKAVDKLDGREVDGRQIMVQFAKYGPNAERIDKGRIEEPVHKSKGRSRSRSPRPRNIAGHLSHVQLLSHFFDHHCSMKMNLWTGVITGTGITEGEAAVEVGVDTNENVIVAGTGITVTEAGVGPEAEALIIAENVEETNMMMTGVDELGLTRVLLLLDEVLAH
ncbi:serine/arginine-rich splicing factor sc35 [Phtheirospermum japonicum]|uniref:Serine/arginine-rich splicing factor sc35 n=1 Tax=Phtheirospermum japonicum TaxID=374723 RepID=A0A830CR62_9LAMI|nr:serine/arginine-rich splicing factor sc35 [Phtheirospermum japonicum]